MRSAIDTNVISALFTGQPASGDAEELLLKAREEGGLVVCGAVYAELQAVPGVKPAFIDRFLSSTGIDVETELSKNVWQVAGSRFAAYSARRKKAKVDEPRRILADFIIGAHAATMADRLLTFNTADYRASFPELRLNR